MGYWKQISRHFKKHVLLIVWVGVNNVIFWSTYYKYKKDAKFYYLRKMLGSSLCLSRGTAAMLNISCCLILLPMCRSIITFVRSCNQHLPKKSAVFLVERCKQLHICFACTIIFATALHTVAHILNALNFSQNYNYVYPEINVASYPGENAILLIVKTGPGITGFAMVLILTLLIISSIQSIRHKFYDIFWYTHHLYIVFLVLLIVHPMRGVLKEQINLQEHLPGCTTSNVSLSLNTSRVCRVPPKFVIGHSDTWIWISIPLVIYLGDAFYRILNRRHPVQLMSVHVHPCQVMELHFHQHRFQAKPGQYILLNVPGVSMFQWHPFSLTYCASNNPKFKIHFRARGNWTNGPFSSVIEEIFVCRFAVLIAGGIGITPFAAVLNHLLTDKLCFRKLKRLHFVWLCREMDAFLWFAELLTELHHKLWKENKPDFLDIQLYVTRFDSNAKLPQFWERYILLAKRLQFGRPNWNNLFKQWKVAYSGSKVGVYCCGPTVLRKQIRNVCWQENKPQQLFIYHQESVS